MLTGPPSPSSALALATTLHLALASLRNHRSAGTGSVSSLAVPSLALAGLPWILPTASGVIAGIAVHVVWFLVCERLTTSRPPVAPPVPPRPAPIRPARSFVSTPVLWVCDETPTIKTFRVARPDGFTFAAGQFVTVRVRVEGKDYARCYSISSAPSVAGYLEFSVRRQGLVSNALHATARPGVSLAIKAPAGAFRYPERDDRPLLLLAGGIGITPLISMIRHAVASEPSRPLTLLYSARTIDDFAFKDELVLAARRHPQLRVYFAVSAGTNDPSHYSGRIDEALIRMTAPEVAHSIALMCGPAEMIATMTSVLASLGVPPRQVRHEVFEPAVAAAAGVRHEPAAAGDGPVSDPRARDHQMHCARAGKAVCVRAGQTLLEAAETGGVAIDSLCRAGVCGTCRIQVRDGEVACDSATLDDDDQREGYVLACVSTAKSDCTVDV